MEEQSQNIDELFAELEQISLAMTVQDNGEEAEEKAEEEILPFPIFDEYYSSKVFDSVFEETVVEKASKKPLLKDPKGGLTAAGRAFFKRTEGANLKPGVRGAADTPEKMRRKGSFLTRFFTNPSGPMVDEKGRATRLALSAAAWGERVPKNMEDAKALAAKGRRLLERYQNTKKKSEEEPEINELVLEVGRRHIARRTISGEI